MKIKVDKSFDKDIRRIKEKKLLQEVVQIVEGVKQAESLEEIASLKKLTGFKDYWRIRVREFRIGIRIEKETVEFIRILNRKDIYKYFP